MGCQRETLEDTPACCRSARETALPSVGASSGLPPGTETAWAAARHRGRAHLPTASQERAVRSPECHCPATEAHGAVASVSHVLNSHSKGEAHVQKGGGGGGDFPQLLCPPLPATLVLLKAHAGPRHGGEGWPGPWTHGGAGSELAHSGGATPALLSPRAALHPELRPSWQVSRPLLHGPGSLRQ